MVDRKQSQLNLLLNEEIRIAQECAQSQRMYTNAHQLFLIALPFISKKVHFFTTIKAQIIFKKMLLKLEIFLYFQFECKMLLDSDCKFVRIYKKMINYKEISKSKIPLPSHYHHNAKRIYNSFSCVILCYVCIFIMLHNKYTTNQNDHILHIL